MSFRPRIDIFLIALFLPAVSFGAMVNTGGLNTSQVNTIIFGSTDVIHNTNSLQSGATFYVSSGTIAGQFRVIGKVVIEDSINDDSDTYFDLVGDDLFLFVHGTLRQTWTTVQVDEFLLLENGDFILLENGDKIILE